MYPFSFDDIENVPGIYVSERHDNNRHYVVVFNKSGMRALYDAEEQHIEPLCNKGWGSYKYRKIDGSLTFCF